MGGKRSAKEQDVTSIQDIAWLAGFIDGEGTIGLNKQVDPRNKQGFPAYRPRLAIVNTNRPNLECAKRIVSEIIGREIRYRPSEQPRGHRPLYIIAMAQSDDVRAVLTAILPLLCGKAEHAALLLQYLDIAPGRGRSVYNGYDGYDDRHEAFYVKMRHLNRRYARGEWENSQREIERLAPLEGEETTRAASQDAEALGN